MRDPVLIASTLLMCIGAMRAPYCSARFLSTENNVYSCGSWVEQITSILLHGIQRNVHKNSEKWRAERNKGLYHLLRMEIAQDNAMLVLVFLSRKAINLPMVFAVAISRGCRLRTLIVVWEAPYLRCGLIHSIMVFRVNFHLKYMIEFLKTSSCKHEHLRLIHCRQKITVH